VNAELLVSRFCGPEWKLTREFLLQDAYNTGTSYLQKTWDSMKAKAEL